MVIIDEEVDLLYNDKGTCNVPEKIRREKELL